MSACRRRCLASPNWPRLTAFRSAACPAAGPGAGSGGDGGADDGPVCLARHAARSDISRLAGDTTSWAGTARFCFDVCALAGPTTPVTGGGFSMAMPAAPDSPDHRAWDRVNLSFSASMTAAAEMAVSSSPAIAVTSAASTAGVRGCGGYGCWPGGTCWGGGGTGAGCDGAARLTADGPDGGMTMAYASYPYRLFGTTRDTARAVPRPRITSRSCGLLDRAAALIAGVPFGTAICSVSPPSPPAFGDPRTADEYALSLILFPASARAFAGLMSTCLARIMSPGTGRMAASSRRISGSLSSPARSARFSL